MPTRKELANQTAEQIEKILQQQDKVLERLESIELSLKELKPKKAKKESK